MGDASTDAASTVARVIDRYRAQVLEGMRTALDRPGMGHVSYMRYHLGWQDADGTPTAAPSGKMLRPALCLLSCEAVGGVATRALPAAVAIELLHNFTLIHDDIEDGSETRHGRATLWRVAGVPQAINAGDGLFVIAQRTLLDLADTGVAHERVLQASRMLNDACMSLCEGQFADLGFEARASATVAEYEEMIAGKTSALLGVAAGIGALAGGADGSTVDAFGRCGSLLGLAFQIQDDVLGVWGDAQVIGKPVADDIRSRKKSFPVVYAMETLRGPERERLDAIYATTDAMSEPAVRDALALIDQSGARTAATNAARARSGEAIAAIRATEIDPERAAEIEALASFFVNRSV